MFDFIPEFFWKIIITLVGAIYQLVNYAYQVFLFLARSNIFNQSTYTDLVERIYVLLGVVMLFIIAYNVLNLVVDPDKNSKGTTVEKMLKNIVISFIMIVLCPSLFNFAFQLQTSILTTNGGVINNMFAENVEDIGGEDTIADGGKTMAVNTFIAFFVPVEGKDNSLPSKGSGTSYTLATAKQKALETGSFNPYKEFAMNIVKDEVEFNWIIALIAGGYLVYVIVSFCFDLAVRACKLAFYQIIAPIAISCRILPEPKSKIFDDWWQATLKTYVAVFIRVLIMNLGVYLVSVFVQSNFFESCTGSECVDLAYGVKLVGYAFIILGILTFVRQAPNLIDEIFHLKSDISLGIRDKLKSASVFHGGAILGAGATSAVRNATHAAVNVRNARGAKAKVAAALRGVGSTAAGGVMGSIRGFRDGKNSGSVSEMVGNARTAIGKTIQKRDEREDYRASQRLGNINGTDPFIGGIAVGAGHLKDMGKGITRWAGINNVEALEKQNAAMASLVAAVDAVKDAAKDQIVKDAAKNKNLSYGITGIEFAAKLEDKLPNGQKVLRLDTGQKWEYTSGFYHRLQQALEHAERTGASSVDFNGVHYNRVADLQDLQGLYLKNFQEQVANSAAKSNKKWEGIPDEVKISLDAVRNKAIALRNDLETSLSSELIAATNQVSAKTAGAQQITPTSVQGDLLFDGENALGKIGDSAKIITQRNNEKITKAKSEESKK